MPTKAKVSNAKNTRVSPNAANSFMPNAAANFMAAKCTGRKPVATAPASPLVPPAPAPAPSPAPLASKQAQLIAPLRAPAGASIAQLTSATGRQAHSVRGTISGLLRKRMGLNVCSATDGSGTRTYRIIDAA